VDGDGNGNGFDRERAHAVPSRLPVS